LITDITNTIVFVIIDIIITHQFDFQAEKPNKQFLRFGSNHSEALKIDGPSLEFPAIFHLPGARNDIGDLGLIHGKYSEKNEILAKIAFLELI